MEVGNCWSKASCGAIPRSNMYHSCWEYQPGKTHVLEKQKAFKIHQLSDENLILLCRIGSEGTLYTLPPPFWSCSFSGGCHSGAYSLHELFEKESESWTAVSPINKMSEDVPECYRVFACRDYLKSNFRFHYFRKAAIFMVCTNYSVQWKGYLHVWYLRR